MWIALLQLAIVAASIAFRPKIPVDPPAGIDELGIPTASSSDPIPVVFGTRVVTPNVVWYGDLRTEGIESDGK